MNTKSTDTTCAADARIIRSQSALDQIVQSAPHEEVADDPNIWMTLPPPHQQPIWPRVWPGL